MEGNNEKILKSLRDRYHRLHKSLLEELDEQKREELKSEIKVVKKMYEMYSLHPDEMERLS